MKIKFPAILFFILIFSAVSTYGQKPAATIPDFSFYTLKDEKLFTKNDIQKDKKILFMLVDVGCEHCQKEVKTVGANYRKFKNVAFYIVSMDVKPALEKFMSSYGKELYGKPNVTPLLDKKPEFIEKFRPDKYPAMFIYSPSHQLIQYYGGLKNIDAVLKATGS